MVIDYYALICSNILAFNIYLLLGGAVDSTITEMSING